MKNGTFYGKRIRQAFSKWRNQFGKPEIPDLPAPPLEQLMLALLSAEAPSAAARNARARIAERMVDLNEVRVSFADELAAIFSSLIPHSLQRSEKIQAALNAVFRKRHSLELDYLHKLGRKEARQQLESFDGVDPQTVASVMLWSLGGHAIPVNEPLLAALKQDGLVDPEATVDEVQGFLERHIQASEAKEFALLSQQYVQNRKAGKSPIKTPLPGGNHKAKSAPVTVKTRRTVVQSGPAKKSPSPHKSSNRTKSKVTSRPQTSKRGR